MSPSYLITYLQQAIFRCNHLLPNDKKHRNKCGNWLTYVANICHQDKKTHEAGGHDSSRTPKTTFRSGGVNSSGTGNGGRHRQDLTIKIHANRMLSSKLKYKGWPDKGDKGWDWEWNVTCRHKRHSRWLWALIRCWNGIRTRLSLPDREQQVVLSISLNTRRSNRWHRPAQLLPDCNKSARWIVNISVQQKIIVEIKQACVSLKIDVPNKCW